MFMEPESINFTLEKWSRTKMLNKGKKTNKQTKKKKQLDKDKAMKKACMFRWTINAVLRYLFGKISLSGIILQEA